MTIMLLQSTPLVVPVVVVGERYDGSGDIAVMAGVVVGMSASASVVSDSVVEQCQCWSKC